VIGQWEEIKKKENNKANQKSILDSVPINLPSLIRAQKLQKKAAKEGFDWEQINDVFDKLDEEIKEFKEAVLKKTPADIQSEIGDIIFVITNIAKFYKVDAEEALRSTNNKFIKRFQYIEEKIEAKGGTLKDCPLEEMERYWQEAKNK
jgi:tetrapyrrole methylase family protein/MazG family protein